MKPGDVFKFTSDQAKGHDLRDKIHIFLCRTDHHRAPDEFAFLFISSSDYGNCFPIKGSDYVDFLKYDSFISCGNLIYYSREFLLAAGLNKCGKMSHQHLVLLRNHLIGHDVMVAWEISIACGALPSA